MPITEELKNLKKFESVGFSHEQSETLADVIEKAQASGQESLKEFISNENKDLRNELGGKIKDVRNELGSEINNVRNEMKNVRSELKLLITEKNSELCDKISGLEVLMATSQKDLLIKIFAIIVGTVGVAVTILKLF